MVNIPAEIVEMMSEMENIRKLYQQMVDQLGEWELTAEEQAAKANLENVLEKVEALKQSFLHQVEKEPIAAEFKTDESTEAEIEMVVAMAVGDVIGKMPDHVPLDAKPADLISRIRRLLSTSENRITVQKISERVLRELKPTEVKTSKYILPSLLNMLGEGEINSNDTFLAGVGAFGEKNLLSTFLAPLVSIYLAYYFEQKDVSQQELDQIVELTGYQGSKKELRRILKKIQQGLELIE